MLKDDKIKVGEKLPPERHLAERFKVSRPSVREALRAMNLNSGRFVYTTQV